MRSWPNNSGTSNYRTVRDLAPFQEIANQHYGGSMPALVQHHLKSSDATFQSEGSAIGAMVDSAQRLREAIAGLNTDLFHQIAYLLTAADGPTLSATWAIFKPSFGLSLESLIVAGIIGVMVWLIFIALWWVLSKVVENITGSRRRLADY